MNRDCSVGTASNVCSESSYVGDREPRTSITRWKYATPNMNLNTPPSLAKYWVCVVNCDQGMCGDVFPSS